MAELPVIECEVTFLSEHNGGRKQFLKGMLSGSQYRPHLVVGDVHLRTPIRDENGNGIEEYLAVAFLHGPDVVEADIALKTVLVLMYFPNIKYEKLVPTATFTVREGGQTVGFGTVLARHEYSEIS